MGIVADALLLSMLPPLFVNISAAFVLAIVSEGLSPFSLRCSFKDCRKDDRFVRSMIIGNNADTVPTFDVSAPFETGMFLASAGEVGGTSRPSDNPIVDGIKANSCRRDEVFAISSMLG
mmetsp:Transcript_5127/g.10756  ORF Transcript_5127/g.10756 Transcript_5127/m.10756 type:complete len:119 (+) Transcript_5127:1898-2254(+)